MHAFMWETCRSLNLLSIACMDKPSGVQLSGLTRIPFLEWWESFPIRPFFGLFDLLWTYLYNGAILINSDLIPFLVFLLRAK